MIFSFEFLNRHQPITLHFIKDHQPEPRSKTEPLRYKIICTHVIINKTYIWEKHNIFIIPFIKNHYSTLWLIIYWLISSSIFIFFLQQTISLFFNSQIHNNKILLHKKKTKITKILLKQELIQIKEYLLGFTYGRQNSH